MFGLGWALKRVESSKEKITDERGGMEEKGFEAESVGRGWKRKQSESKGAKRLKEMVMLKVVARRKNQVMEQIVSSSHFLLLNVRMARSY